MAGEDDPGSADKTASHARGPTAEAKALKRSRIAHIMGMMERFEWIRGESAEPLADEWGLAVPTVEGYAAEAHRRCIADKDEAEREISHGARKLFRDAVNNGDAKAAKLMGDLWADVSGAKAPVKQEHKVAGVSLDELDDIKKSTGFEECPPETEPDS